MRQRRAWSVEAMLDNAVGAASRSFGPNEIQNTRRAESRSRAGAAGPEGAAEKGPHSGEALEWEMAGAKAQIIRLALSARLKSCPDASCLPDDVFPQPVKARRFRL